MAPGCKECPISVYLRLKKVNKHFYEKEVNMKMGETENVQVRKELLLWECSSRETYWNGKVDRHVNFPFHAKFYPMALNQQKIAWNKLGLFTVAIFGPFLAHFQFHF